MLRTGFTITELAATIAATALLASQAVKAIGPATAAARVFKDTVQMQGLHAAWITKSIDFPNENPPNTMPTPGLINRLGNIPGRGEPDLTKNDHASLFAMSIAQNLFSPALCVSPCETSSNVGVCKAYDYKRYNPQADTFWDGDKPGPGPFTAECPGNFKANLKRSSHVSYGTMPIVSPMADAKNSRCMKAWREDGASNIAVLGNRGVQDGIDSTAKGPELEIHNQSKTLQIHGSKDAWQGTIVFGDHRTHYLKTPFSDHCIKIAEPTRRRVPPGSNCASDEGLDNVFREDDPTGFSDSWLCVVPFLTVTNNGRIHVPTDKTLLYD
jgi:hypothetical protein